MALNDGQTCGREGRGFARLNTACARDTLREAARRITELAARGTLGGHASGSLANVA